MNAFVRRALFLLVLIATLLEHGRAVADPLNLVVFLTDDQRFDSLWAMPIVRDRLASRGVTFTNAVATTPFCSPFRASFLSSGFYAHNTGVLLNIPPNGGVTKFFDRDTLPLRLQQDGGLATFLVGKYMNGYYYSAVDESPKYVPPGWTRWMGWSGGGPLDKGRLILGTSTTEPATGAQLPAWVGHEVDVYTDHTLDFLNETQGANRFIYFSTLMPHYPATPEPSDAELFPDFVYRGRSYGELDLSDKPVYVQSRASPFWFIFDTLEQWDEYNRDILRSLQVVDRAVGTIFDWFEQAGELDHTIFVFTSDNGWMWGEHGLHGKTLPYEESIRVPLIVVMPGIQPRDDDSLVAVDLDVPATLLDLAGLPIPGDGMSLVPLLQNPTTPWREDIFLEQYGEGWAAIRSKSPIDGQEWKYVWYGRGRTEIELYDLTNDPLELESLHADPSQQERIAEYHARLTELVGLHVNSARDLPRARFGTPYSYTIGKFGGEPPYQWKIDSGELPTGLQLDPDLGTVSGIPTEVVQDEIFSVELSSASIATHKGTPQTHVRDMRLTVLEGDVDDDLIADGSDNCPMIPNGPAGGTCTTGELRGIECQQSSDCGPREVCSLAQEDDNNDGIGDACDPTFVPEPGPFTQLVVGIALFWAIDAIRRKRKLNCIA